MQGEDVQSRPTGLHDHHDPDDLLQHFVERAEGGASHDVGMAHRRLLDLHGTYDLPPPVDDLLRSSGDEEVSVRVHVSQVAGVEPPPLQEGFRDGFAGFVRDLAIPAKARLSPDAYGPLLAGGEGLERRRVEYRELGSDGHAGGASFVQAVRRRGRCNRHAFRHSIRGKHLMKVSEKWAKGKNGKDVRAKVGKNDVKGCPRCKSTRIAIIPIPLPPLSRARKK